MGGWLFFTGMLEDLFYDLLVLYEGDDPHPALAFCTGKRVYFIDLLDQSGPILSVLFFDIHW